LRPTNETSEVRALESAEPGERLGLAFLDIFAFALMAIPSGGNVNPQDSANKRITGMFEKRSDRGYHPALDGIERKTLAHGVRTLMRRLLTGGCLLCALWCANTMGQAPHASFRIEGLAARRDVEFTARADSSRQRYVEFLPLEHTSNLPCSLMIFLHGHGADRWQIMKGDQWREIQAVCDVAARRHIILISPDYRATTSWMGPAAEADLVQIIQEQKTRHSLSKTYLCGGSMGGTSVLIFTALHPELVDGVVSMNGTANMMEFAGFEDAIAASYGGKKSERPDEYRKRSPELMAAKFGTMPVAFTAGGKDAVVPPQSVLRLSKELEKQNPGRVLMLYRQEVGHTTSYEDAIVALDFVIERSTPSSDRAELIRTLEPLSERGVRSSRPLVGTIRWDAWSSGRVTEEVERTLGPAKYHDRLPWFAKVTGEHQVRIDGSQPGIMEQEIDFAANAGLDYWAFLLYPESDSMSVALKQYLKSPKRRRLNFCVILHNALGVPEAAWPRELARLVSLLKETGYQTVLGNRPLVFEFQARLGGQFPRQRFAEFRRAAQEAGLNPYCVFMGWNPAADFARESVNGFDAVSAYALGSDVRTFAELARQVERNCWQQAAEARVPSIPLVTTGWDKQPRKDHPVSWEKNHAYHQQRVFPSTATPQEIASHLERALGFVGNHSDCCPANAVIVYAWNEHDEGGWLAPTWTPSGQANTTRLSAVRAVLSNRGASLVSPPETTERGDKP
jgi:pimeloyl-ACP methyl ester carboxylesterase